METVNTIKKLVDNLNYYRNQYYNNNISEISDAEYDQLYDELEALENSTGIILSNSPTQTVGYTVQSSLAKVKHNHPMLSLGKTKKAEDVLKWSQNKDIVIMHKLDGLSGSLAYDENGWLISAETRGDGEVGEDITANIKMVSNVPLKIVKGPLVVDGEIIVKKENFEEINNSLGQGNEFSHPRNYAAGSIRQLDVKITKERNLSFIAWRLIDGEKSNSFYENLKTLVSLGFEVTCFKKMDFPYTEKDIEKNTEEFKQVADNLGIPIDGCVFTYDNEKYGMSLGMTGHHPRHSFAFKYGNDEVETVVRQIEWTVGKSGLVSPVAVFDPIDLGGAITTKATLFNLSFLKNLGITKGSHITVIRSNEVIPKIERNLSPQIEVSYPCKCPSCGSNLEIKVTENSETLWCRNPDCPSKKIARFKNFVSKNAMNIDGLSEATIIRFIDKGYLHNLGDLYNLNRYRSNIQMLEGFGTKSTDKLMKAIENSRNTTLERFLIGLSIPNIGKSAAKTISSHFKGSWSDFMSAIDQGYNFINLPDFGGVMNDSLHEFFNDKSEKEFMGEVVHYLNFIVEEDSPIIEGYFTGKRFCITGTFSKSRDELKKEIEAQGGVFVSGVSKKLDVLVAGEKAGSKLQKAEDLGIKIMNEEELLKELKND